MGKWTVLAALTLVCLGLIGALQPAARSALGWSGPAGADDEALASGVALGEAIQGGEAVGRPAGRAAPLAVDTPSATPSPTATATITSTLTPTPTGSTTPTGSPSPAPDTATVTATPTLTGTSTPLPTATPLPSYTPTAMPPPRPTVGVTVLPRGVPSRVPTAVIVLGPPVGAGPALPTVERQERPGSGGAMTPTGTALAGRVPTVQTEDWTEDLAAKRGGAVQVGIFEGPVLGWLGAFGGWLVVLIGVVVLGRRTGIRRG